MQFQTSKKVGGQGEKVQAIKKLASFFNTARQAFCRFKPKGFDSRKAKPIYLFKTARTSKCDMARSFGYRMAQ